MLNSELVSRVFRFTLDAEIRNYWCSQRELPPWTSRLWTDKAMELIMAVSLLTGFIDCLMIHHPDIQSRFKHTYT